MKRDLALNLPRTAHVKTVQVQQVEGVEDLLILAAIRPNNITLQLLSGRD